MSVVRDTSRRPRIWPTTIVCAGLALLLAGPAAAELTARRSFEGDRLELRNLIGEISVEGHGGGGFEVEVAVQGRDAAEGMIRLETEKNGLRIVFPAGEKNFVYPPLGSGSTTFDGGDGGWLSDVVDNLMGRGRVRVRGSGSGTQVWADVTIRVPTGGQLELEHGVGAINVVGVEGDLELSTRSGDISAERIGGDLQIATGSGAISVTDVRGRQIEIATGSGRVKAEQCDGDQIQIATGSGRIEVQRFVGRSVELATGSGSVRADGISSDDVSIGTGSGEVTLTLDQLGSGDCSVGTGSGDIKLRIPSGASAQIHAETDRGDIEVALSGPVDYSRREDDEVELTIGGGGGRVRLGSGSGDIRIED